MSEEEVLSRFADEPITVQRLVDDLRNLGVNPGMTLIVHTKLSSMGWVCGGAVAVILALEEVVRDYGTVVMPAHSGDLSDPAQWENPPVPESWRETIRRTMPPFDPELTPTRGLGVVPELFRTQTAVVRSYHPTVSFAAWGKDAVEIVADHSLSFSLGEKSPLGVLYEKDAWVLMLGTGFDTNTSFHLSEYRADYPKKQVVQFGSPVVVEGHRRWMTYDEINYNSDDFEDVGTDFEKRHKQDVTTGSVGMAQARLFPMRLCVDFAVDWFPRHRL